MRQLSLLCFIVIGAGLVGCGGTPCSRFNAVQSNLVSKKGNCNVTLTTNTSAKCDAAYAAGTCTKADETAHHKALDCTMAVETCVAGMENQWLSKLAGCALSNPLSTACTNALSN